ncbi:MAG: site-specific DNA-methyltransferase [Dehalococcoidia bacterium]|nr:site-specific DNA-methyltransferase [Dehalococcoidia bacterium]
MPPPNRSALGSRIHAYAASFGDDLAHEIIAGETHQGDTVLDPFVGAGTTALQALLLNRNAIGIDIDPIASRISRVVTARFDVDYLTTAIQSFEGELFTFEALLAADPSVYQHLFPGSTFSLGHESFQIPDEEAIAFWFHPSHMATLAIVKRLLDKEPDQLVKQFFEVVLSSTIIRKWPNTLSYAMDIDHSRPHRTRSLRVQSIHEQFSLVHRIVQKALRTVMNIQTGLGNSSARAEIREGDVTKTLGDLEDETIDFVLTSPPYLNAIDYPRAHKFSQWWLSPNQPPIARSKYLGLRRGLGAVAPEVPLNPAIQEVLTGFEESKRYQDVLRYVSDLRAVIEQVNRVAKPRAKIAFVVADNVLNGNIFPTSRIVTELLADNDVSGIRKTQRTIKSTRRRYPFGINGFANTMRDEYLITGHKPE